MNQTNIVKRDAVMSLLQTVEDLEHHETEGKGEGVQFNKFFIQYREDK